MRRFNPWSLPQTRDRVAIIAASLVAFACSRDQHLLTSPESNRSELSSASAGSPATVKIPGQYIVVLKNEVVDVDGAANALTAKYQGKLLYVWTAALKGLALNVPDASAAALRREPTVAYVEQDQQVHATTTQPNTTWGLQRVSQPVPLQVDSGRGYGYYPPNPFSNAYSYTYFADGTGVTVYIIDTGIETSHPDFGGRASVGFDAFGGNGIDCNGHGTHVAGTVGGTNWGVAKNVHLVAVRVLGCDGGGSESSVVAGVNWVAANRVLPAVANMSLGGPTSTALNQAVETSITGGVTYAVAAGNDAIDACNVSPASAADAITVGATAIGNGAYASDPFAWFSNYGSCVKINAPGVAITSDWLNAATRVDTGTSMASPHVAGTAALYLSLNAAATPAQVRAALTTNADSGFIVGLPANTPDLVVYGGFIGTSIVASGGLTASSDPTFCDASGGATCPEVNIVALTASGSNALTVRDSYNHAATVTLTGASASGGLTASPDPTVCDASQGQTCPAVGMVAVTSSGSNVINLRDTYNHTATSTLSGATTASAGLTAYGDESFCDAAIGQTCPSADIIAITARSNAIILRDSYAHNGFIMLR